MFRDHFSAHAEAYARFRPGYPDALFDWLAGETGRRELAVDCATGNGQAATGLAARFARVVAIDASAEQIRHAVAHPRVEYRVAPAESTGLPAGAADLVTVAQALHWLRHDAFFAEARRILRPEGVIAAWGYGVPRVSPAIDPVLDEFYTAVVGPFWPPERRMVDEEYRSVAFPFTGIHPPVRFTFERDIPLDALTGYIGTWSASRRMLQATGRDPIPELAARLAPRWGEPAAPRRVVWPIFVRAGRASLD